MLKIAALALLLSQAGPPGDPWAAQLGRQLDDGCVDLREAAVRAALWANERGYKSTHGYVLRGEHARTFVEVVEEPNREAVETVVVSIATRPGYVHLSTWTAYDDGGCLLDLKRGERHLDEGGWWGGAADWPTMNGILARVAELLKRREVEERGRDI